MADRPQGGCHAQGDGLESCCGTAATFRELEMPYWLAQAQPVLAASADTR
jgi:hypothetical protein